MGRMTKSLSKKSCMLLSVCKHFIFNQEFIKDLLNRCRGPAAAITRWIDYHRAKDDKHSAKSHPCLVLAAIISWQVDCCKMCG